MFFFIYKHQLSNIQPRTITKHKCITRSLAPTPQKGALTKKSQQLPSPPASPTNFLNCTTSPPPTSSKQGMAGLTTSTTTPAMIPMTIRVTMVTPVMNRHLLCYQRELSLAMRSQLRSGGRMSIQRGRGQPCIVIIIITHGMYGQGMHRQGVQGSRWGRDPINCTKFNLAFRLTASDASLTSLGSDRGTRVRPNISHDHPTNFSKYPGLPMHSHRPRPARSPSPPAPGHKSNTIRWSDMNNMNQTDSQASFTYRNAFPKRSTKDSSQLIVNMLMRYERHYGRHNPEASHLHEGLTDRTRAREDKKFRQRVKKCRYEAEG